MATKTIPYGPSRSFEVMQLSEKISRYVLKNDDCARVELLNQVITGDELTDALAYLKPEIKRYNEKKENNEIDELISSLEKIIQGKEGTIIKEIEERLNEYKQTSS